MKEEFLHYLWKYRLYDHNRLFDSEGNLIQVISPGIYNRDSGPDFFNARLLIDGTEWAGNVEIHINSSHFESHGHQHDPAYNNVILHVVANNDKTVFNLKGEELLTAELPVDVKYYEQYQNLVNNPCTIACEKHISQLESVHINHWLSSLAAERLQRKSESILRINESTGNDWEETLYIVLSRYFGFRVNTEPFELLASALPFRIIRKHSDNRLQVESLLFGTAGMLDETLFKEAVSDNYYKELMREYRILSMKYSLQPIHGWLWKFSRLRPSNFPTLRISQLAALVSVSGGLFARITEVTELSELSSIFEVTASEYWDTHFVFGKKSRNTVKSTGEQAKEIIFINAVIPVLFAFGLTKNRNEICERALNFLDLIEPEKNVIISEWEKACINPHSALYSQALIQLRNEYCRIRRCLECRIGSKIISSGGIFREESELMLEP
jgi:hypothetical protein